MDCHTLWKVPGRLQMVWQASKLRWLSVSTFLIEAEYTKVYVSSQINI
jgi:hypothetical protein